MFWDNYLSINADRIQAEAPAPEQTALVPLSEYAFIHVSGPDSVNFLQGQCTCDFTLLDQTLFIRGAHCTPKGRMIATFVAAKWHDGSIALRLKKEIADNTLNALKKYAVFSKVTLAVNDNLYSSAIIQEAKEPKIAQDTEEKSLVELNENSIILHHSDALSEIWFEEKDAETALTQYNSLSIYTNQNYWTLKNIERGIAELHEPLIEKLLPQEMNYQLINGVSFTKGCYTGQEIIARVHYKAQLKKHMYRGAISADKIEQETTSPIFPGAIITTDTPPQKNVGMLINLALNTKNEYEFLALCEDNFVDGQNCFVGTDKPLKIQWLPLPYAIH